MNMLNSREVKDYLSHHHLPQLLESLLTGLLYHHPEDPISFLHSCLTTTSQLGGPRAVTWDTFIHLERHRPSQGPPWTTCVPPKAQFVITRTLSVPPRTTSEPLNTASVAPKTTIVSITTQQILQTTSQITPLTPSITRKTTSIPPIKTLKTPTLLQTSALKPATEPPKPQNILPIQQTISPKPSKSSPTPRIIPPIPPTSITAPPRHVGTQTPSIKPIITFLTPLTPPVSSISNTTLFGPPQTASEQYPKLLPPAPPERAVTPPPNLNETKEERNKTTNDTEGPPPSPVRSQLSIDSDSDMTESSGLQQEVSIKLSQRPCPIIFIIGGPGSGKGSQAALLAKSFNLRVISLDELLRRQLLCQASPGRKWEVISQMMSHAELGSQEETISELRRQLIGQQKVKGFILDGFPRDVHQALSFQEQIGSPDLVMLLLCSNETLRCRLQRRATELGLLGDSSYALRKRIDSFQRDIISVRRYYKQLNLLKQVDADRDEDQVFADLKSVIIEKLPQKESSDLADIKECSGAVPPASSC